VGALVGDCVGDFEGGGVGSSDVTVRGRRRRERGRHTRGRGDFMDGGYWIRDWVWWIVVGVAGGGAGGGA
jgi:hypothetical protein